MCLKQVPKPEFHRNIPCEVCTLWRSYSTVLNHSTYWKITCKWADHCNTIGSGIVQTECRSLIVHHNVCHQSALSWGGLCPPRPPPWWIIDPSFLNPKPKTLSLKPKEKANLFEKKNFLRQKKKKQCTNREPNMESLHTNCLTYPLSHRKLLTE